ncbi:PREDICTED: protein FAR-RED IMPAIRED RESPONSE 1-like [Nelumbo nucifera]|uniref:Protein FAR1-RELATED SEQUENCE n=1 Tax=Nelumbo nucifera TaxID=4432 RepID=A0A1U8ATV6_NELNU|nr:PREDICTED: protein FAR-RED IMPAIRED RESPONSE 1-like [Nelumbo nucifera]XP_010269884.1 PREDICTED: protein FAR-RED IMPAIRED RESPONSE 1-like [Nelumbo nucifera]
MEIDLEVNADEHEMEDSRSNGFGNTMSEGETQREDELALNFPSVDHAFAEEDENFEPCKGMEFDSHEEAYLFYEEYARSLGFTIKKKNTRRSTLTGKFIDAHFACFRQGSYRQKGEAVNSRPSHRTDCKASMHVKRRQDGKWVVHNFVKEHNHELLPARAFFFRRRRSMSLISKKILDILHIAQIQTSNVCAMMSSNQHSGYQSVDCPEEDIRNQMDREGRLAIESEDARAMLDHFMHMQEENPNFFYVIDLNDEQRLRNVFWVDVKGRNDYFSYGDVVYFDTTYLAKKYKVPFVPLVGLNHHFQPILFGCALLADKARPTFIWLMRTWLKVMGGVAPKVIITNQEKAVKAAVAEVFPNIHHQFCLWHILRSVTEKLGHVIERNKNFIEEFNNCVFRSWTEGEFENQWLKMIENFEIQEDDWIITLYEDRKHWVPAYIKDTSLVGMSSTHQSENISSFFDKYVYKNTPLKEFLVQYKVIQQDSHDEESKADFDTWHGVPTLKTHSPYEKQMSTIYTHEIFRKFQVEVSGIVACHPRKEKEDGTKIIYTVLDYEAQKEYIVAWDETKSEVSCLCHLFEYKGFLCRHAMIVLQFSAVTEIPSQYILKRWTKDARSRHAIGQRSEEVDSRAKRCNDLCQRAINLGIEASISQESYDIAVQALEEAIRKSTKVNNSIKYTTKPSASAVHGGFGTEETMQRLEHLSSMMPACDDQYDIQQRF